MAFEKQVDTGTGTIKKHLNKCLPSYIAVNLLKLVLNPSKTNITSPA